MFPLHTQAWTNDWQLSQQLRTRLTYAMVKVQNGWQTRSLDEIESIASQSPRSTISGFPRNTLHSPRSVMSGNLQRTWSSSDSSDDAPIAQLPAMAYGSTMQAPQPKRGLAPPADIISGGRRRLTPNANGYTNGPPCSHHLTITQQSDLHLNFARRLRLLHKNRMQSKLCCSWPAQATLSTILLDSHLLNRL